MDAGSLDLDYEDWEEALARWLLELPDGPPKQWMTFDHWAAFHHTMFGDFALLDRLNCTTPPNAVLAALRIYRRGIITSSELAGMLLMPDARFLWNQLWSGIAAHRAGADWLGHLVLAALAGCEGLANLILVPSYLDLRKERALASRAWSRSEDHMPSEFGDGWSHREAMARDALEACGWDGDDRTRMGEAEFPLDLDWIGWQGMDAPGDAAADAALQALWGNGMPLVAHLQGFRNYVIVQPEDVTAGGIVGRELLRDDAVRIERSFTSTVGWHYSVDAG